MNIDFEALVLAAGTGKKGEAEVDKIMTKIEGKQAAKYGGIVDAMMTPTAIASLKTYLTSLATDGESAKLKRGSAGVAQFLASYNSATAPVLDPADGTTVAASTAAASTAAGGPAAGGPALDLAATLADINMDVRSFSRGLAAELKGGQRLFDAMVKLGLTNTRLQNKVLETLEDANLVTDDLLREDINDSPLVTQLTEALQPLFAQTSVPDAGTSEVSNEEPPLTENEPKKQNGLMAKKTDVFDSTITGMLKDMGIRLTRKTPTSSDEKQLNITDRGKKQLLDITERGRAGLIKIMETTDLTNLPKNIAEQRIKAMLYKIVNARTKGNLRRYDEVNLQDTIKALTEVLYDQVAQGKGT